jgi:hypothetical protein
LNSGPGENAPRQPAGNNNPLRRLVHQMPSAVSPRMSSWESPEREPVAWSKSPSRARSQPLSMRVLKTTRSGKEANAWAVDDLRQAVRTGLVGGDYTMLFLWIRFWSKGGGACMAELDAFLRGLQALSDKDSVVLGFAVDDLHSP